MHPVLFTSCSCLMVVLWSSFSLFAAQFLLIRPLAFFIPSTFPNWKSRPSNTAIVVRLVLFTSSSCLMVVLESSFSWFGAWFSFIRTFSVLLPFTVWNWNCRPCSIEMVVHMLLFTSCSSLMVVVRSSFLWFETQFWCVRVVYFFVPSAFRSWDHMPSNIDSRPCGTFHVFLLFNLRPFRGLLLSFYLFVLSIPSFHMQDLELSASRFTNGSPSGTWHILLLFNGCSSAFFLVVCGLVFIYVFSFSSYHLPSESYTLSSSYVCFFCLRSLPS